MCRKENRKEYLKQSQKVIHELEKQVKWPRVRNLKGDK